MLVFKTIVLIDFLFLIDLPSHKEGIALVGQDSNFNWFFIFNWLAVQWCVGAIKYREGIAWASQDNHFN